MAMILIIVLIIMNALFAASEVSLIAVNDSKVEADAANGNKKAKKILKFIDRPTNFLSTIQIGITVIGFLNGFLAADTYATNLTVWAAGFIPLSELILRPIITFLITLILAYFQVVFGELVPKRVAMKYPEKIAYAMVGLLSGIATVVRPFIWLLTTSANGIVRIFGIDPNANESNMTEEEIRMLVTSSSRKGVLQKDESDMIENILDFDDTSVSEIMTHRTEMAAIDVKSSKKEILDTVRSEKYTRYPVYQDSVDQIIGILHVKDLLKYIDEPNEKFSLRALIRPPYFVPDSKKTNELLNEMKKQQTHIAIAIDEYGGTAGLVTIEDLLEEIVGNIFDEYDDMEEEIAQINDLQYDIDGLTNIDDVEDIIKVGLPVEDYDTLSGFILGQLGRFPEEDEKIEIEYKDAKFEVLQTDDKIITKVRVTKIEQNLENTENS